LDAPRVAKTETVHILSILAELTDWGMGVEG
jgi:hypothetical protein